ncbi:hypothetical protein GCM10023238_21130 [Streptomyces heliomycini]
MRRTPLDAVGHWVGTLLAAVSFALGLVLFTDLLGKGAEERTVTQHLSAGSRWRASRPTSPSGSTSCR